MFGQGLQSVVQKSFGPPWLATVNDYFKIFYFYFGTVDLVMRWVSVAIPLRRLVQFFGFCLTSLVGWQHLVGVVQRNQPRLHGHPVGWIEF